MLLDKILQIARLCGFRILCEALYKLHPSLDIIHQELQNQFKNWKVSFYMRKEIMIQNEELKRIS